MNASTCMCEDDLCGDHDDGCLNVMMNRDLRIDDHALYTITNRALVQRRDEGCTRRRVQQHLQIPQRFGSPGLHRLAWLARQGLPCVAHVAI